MRTVFVTLVLAGAAAGGAAYYAKHVAAGAADGLPRGDDQAGRPARDDQRHRDVGAGGTGRRRRAGRRLIVEFGPDPRDADQVDRLRLGRREGRRVGEDRSDSLRSGARTGGGDARTLGGRPVAARGEVRAGPAGMEARRGPASATRRSPTPTTTRPWPTTSRPRRTWRSERRPSGRTRPR